VSKNEIKKVIQFSPPRSGSTFVTQIMKELLPNIKVMKIHKCFKERGTKVVVTIRDFRDILASNWRVLNNITFDELSVGRKITDAELKIEMDRTIYFVEELHKMVNYYGDQMSILKYEEFYNNHNFLYDALESCLSVNVSTELRQNLSEKYGMKANRERADKLDGFRKWDSSGIHGNHVYKGEVGTWRKMVQNNHHE